MKNTLDTSIPAQMLVTRISTLMEDLHGTDRELVAAFRRAPSTASFDRAMAFRTLPLEEEFRAAVGRLERGAYGRCVLCGEIIALNQMVESPFRRHCSRCLERPGGSVIAPARCATDAQDNR